MKERIGQMGRVGRNREARKNVQTEGQIGREGRKTDGGRTDGQRNG